MTKPATPSNCMQRADRHEPHEWELKGRGHTYACDGSGVMGYESQWPITGDRVLYMPDAVGEKSGGPGPWAAVVTATCDRNGAPLEEGTVWLTVFPPFAPPGNCNVPVPFDATGLPHTWTREPARGTRG